MCRFLSYFREKNEPKSVFSYDGFIRFVPLLLTGTFFAATIFLCAFGPMDWHIENPLKLYSFLIFALIALCAGYFLSTYKARTSSSVMKVDVSKIVLICSAVYIVLYFPLCKSLTGSWFPNIYLGITNTGIAYQVAKYYSEYGSKTIFYINILLSPILFAIRPLVLIFWKRLSKIAKILGVTVILLEVSLGIAQGLNKQVADIVIQLVLILCIVLFASKKETRKQKLTHAVKVISLILAICLCFVLYYGNSIRNRVSMDITMLENNIKNENIIEFIEKFEKEENNTESIDKVINDNSKFTVATERENTIWNLLPSKIKPIINYLTSYFCHGYKGLSYAMEEDFTSTYGLGFSEFFRHNALRFFGGEEVEKEIFNRTYMGKINEKWPSGMYWSTFFTFPASDITFFGTIFLVFAIGFLFGLSWKDCVLSGNPFAAMSFFGFIIMTFYFSANNQMFQMGEHFIAFVFSIVMWLITRTVWSKRVKE